MKSLCRHHNEDCPTFGMDYCPQNLAKASIASASARAPRGFSTVVVKATREPRHIKLEAIPHLKAFWTRDGTITTITGQGIPCFLGNCGETYRESGFASAEPDPGATLHVAKESEETTLVFLGHQGFGADYVHALVSLLRNTSERPNHTVATV